MCIRDSSDAVIQSFRYYDISKDEYRPADVSVPDFTREYNLKDIVNMWDDVYDGLSFHGVIYNTGFYKALEMCIRDRFCDECKTKLTNTLRSALDTPKSQDRQLWQQDDKNRMRYIK